MPTHMRHIFLLLLLSLLALPATAAPIPAASPSGSAATVPDASASGPSSSSSPDTLAPVFPLFPAWFTTPDRAPFRGPSLSAVAFLNPPMPLSPRNERRALIPVAAGFGAELQFDKSNALRLHYGYVRADYPRTKNESLARNFNRHSINLDYLWNLTNHYYGYDPARSWEFLAVAGVSYGWAFPHDLYGRLYEGLQKAPSQHYLQGQLGFQIRKTLSPHLSAFLEPNYYVAQSNYDFYDNGSDLDDGLAFKAGIIYRLAGPLRQTPWFDHLYSLNTTLNSKLSTLNSFFVQNLLGLNFSNIKSWPQDNHVLSNYSFNLAVGQWLHPAWGYRVALVDRQVLPDAKRNSLGRLADVQSYRQTYARLESVFNIPAFWDEVSIGRIGFDFSAGIEMGLNRRYNIHRDSKGATLVSNYRLFPGITSALQLKYHFNDYVALVGEGRFGYFDRRASVFTPAIGLEYANSPFRRFIKRPVSPASAAHTEAFDEFGSRFFVEAALGFSKQANQRFASYPVSPLAEFAIGMQLNPFYAIRLKEHLIYHRTRLARKTEDRFSNFHSQLALDYLFDLTNYWMGIDPDRRVSLRPFAGLVYSARPLNTGKDTPTYHRLGFNFGLQHAINLNRNFAFTLEPRYLSVIDDFNHWSLSLGARYVPYFDSSSYRRAHGSDDKESKPSRSYLQLSGGLQLTQAFESVTFGRYGGFDFTYGHNIIPNLDLQSSFFFQYHHNNYGKVPEEHLLGLRVEAVAQFLNMMWPEATARGYALTVQGGYDFASSHERDRWSGPTIASQFRRRLGQSPVWFTALGRLQARTSPSNNSNFSLHLGLHYAL